MKSYQTGRSFDLLLDRMQFLSSNYVVYRRGVTEYKTSKLVKSGIYFNYRLCGTYRSSMHSGYDGAGLKALDAFYHSLIYKSPDFSGLFSLDQRTHLSKISFFKGFELKMTVDFPTKRVRQIKRAWRNV
jgi:hypothetical protein